MKRLALGLPGSVAVITLGLFSVAFLFYAVAWRRAPFMNNDSGQYLEVARDLSDLRLDSLHFRPIGYQVLLSLTGSATRPARALFFVSMLLHLLSVWLLMAVLHRL